MQMPTRNSIPRLAIPIFMALTAVVHGVALAEVESTSPTDKPVVDVGNPSVLRYLIPASMIENYSAMAYQQMMGAANKKGALLPPEDPLVVRVQKIAERLMANAFIFNSRANSWKWEVHVIRSKTVNAFCMPGGKIAFYTGIIDTLKMSDGEIAIVMGHEMAHALREHGREQMAKNIPVYLAVQAVDYHYGSGWGQVADMGRRLLSLKFSRSDEEEADIVGLELAARAGFDPRWGVGLWQKMAKLAKNSPPQFLSDHPSNENRVQIIEAHLPETYPLYLRARTSVDN